MTTPNGPVVLNTGTGHDTQSSGIGPSTSVYGSGASTNNTTTVDLSADTPDLSGVSAGDMLWVNSSSGLKFSIIASVDDGADTVTTDDTWTQTEGSRNWAIGGKRATLNGLANLFQYNQGITIELEDDQTVTSQISQAVGSRSGSISIQSDTPGTKRQIEANGFSTNAFYMYQSCVWTDIEFQYDSTQTGSNRNFLWTRTNYVTLIDCSTGSGGLYRLTEAKVANGVVRCYGCDFTAGSMHEAIEVAGGLAMVNCKLGAGVDCGAIDYPSFFYHCVFKDGGRIKGAAGSDLNYVANCVFDNSSPAIDSGRGLVVINSIFVDCTTAIQVDGPSEFIANVGNAFYNCTTDESHDARFTMDKVSLTADPFTDSANDDYTLNSTAGGGAACKDVGFSTEDIFGNTRNQNIGLYGSSSGGGGGLTRIRMNGGLDS